MSEKYKVVYTAGENLYTEGSPVMVRRASLLRNIKSAEMLCKLRLINITDRTINRIKVSVVTDAGSASWETEYICVIRDAEESVYIPLEGFGHTTFSFVIDELSFTDGSTQSVDACAEWTPVTFPETLEDYLLEEDLVREFRSRFTDGVYFPAEERDLWFCTCGELNHKSEAACHACSRKYLTLKKFGVEELKNAVAKQKRLEAINKEKFDEAYNKVLVDQKSKRGRTFMYILIAAAIITVIALLIAADGNHYTQAI